MPTDGGQAEGDAELTKTPASDDVFVGIDSATGNDHYVHRPCGKHWYEQQGDDSPNNCPGCGEVLFDDE